MQHREEIVRLHETERLSEREIARRLELPFSTVHYWLAKEHAPPREGVARRGRPRVTTSDEDSTLHLLSLSKPFTSAVGLRDELMPNVSVDTVRKRLKELGMRCCIPARKPFLRPIHIQKRLEFARNHRNWGVDEWSCIVFSDEKIFRSSSTGQLRVYRPRKSDRYHANYIYTGPSQRMAICVWMAFGKNFRQIHRIEQRTLNADYYTDVILEQFIHPHFREHKDLLFQQDLSSIHKSRKTLHWLETRNVSWMDDWPPKGPDMNPVENVWAELVRRIRNDPTNREQLWENVHAAFNQLDETYFNNLIISMPRRMRKVIEAEGRWTKY